MKSVDPQTDIQTDDSRRWIGGEATVGSQAHRHIRRQAGPPASLLGIILGLTFFGGLALGSSFGLLCRSRADALLKCRMVEKQHRLGIRF